MTIDLMIYAIISLKNTTKLSNTIDNFSNFFNKDDLGSSNFELVETIGKILLNF